MFFISINSDSLIIGILKFKACWSFVPGFFPVIKNDVWLDILEEVLPPNSFIRELISFLEYFSNVPVTTKINSENKDFVFLCTAIGSTPAWIRLFIRFILFSVDIQEIKLSVIFSPIPLIFINSS